VAVVDLGRVIAEGTPAELKARLGSTVIEIGMGEEAAAVHAERILAGIGESEREGAVIRLASGDGPKVLMVVLRSLDAEDLGPVTLTVREPSLDDVFLKLTGRHAEPVRIPQEPVPAGGAG
jgi:ABC-2 type transport system ATP-binding protein